MSQPDLVSEKSLEWAELIAELSECIKLVAWDLGMALKTREYHCVPEVNETIAQMALQTSLSMKTSAQLVTSVGSLRDSYTVARTIVETVVNMTLIMGEGAQLATRAQRHAKQKGFRNLQRDIKIGQRAMSTHWTGKLTGTERADIDKILPEFTRKNGRESRDLVDLSIVQKLEKIQTKFDDGDCMLLELAYISIYRHASEIAHGTFYGAMFFVYGTTPKSTHETAGVDHDVFDEHATSVGGAVVAAALAFINMYGSYSGDGRLKEQSKVAMLKMFELGIKRSEPAVSKIAKDHETNKAGQDT